MTKLMTGKVVVVTGGASGIGRASALAFARQGAGVLIADIDDIGAETAVATIRQHGGEASFVRADVTRRPTCRR
jgi:NAD(P)-dependent dehydrogenase (short-subunit alcohol dehydrogenase family)